MRLLVIGRWIDGLILSEPSGDLLDLCLMLALLRAQTRVLAFLKCLFEVIFILEQLRARTDSLGSVCQGVNDTKLRSQVVVTVPLQVQICLCVGFL